MRDQGVCVVHMSPQSVPCERLEQFAGRLLHLATSDPTACPSAPDSRPQQRSEDPDPYGAHRGRCLPVVQQHFPSARGTHHPFGDPDPRVTG